MDGLILVRKPQNITSHDVILKIRKIFGIQKVGHFGTLDPMATGLLIVSIGKATKLFPVFSAMNKVYEGQIRLGFSTDTYDAQGERTSETIVKFPSMNDIALYIRFFKGKTYQVPPPYSAVKYKGQPLYKLARKNLKIKTNPRQIWIYSFFIKNYEPPFLDFELECSSGTYIRSLAHELGEKIGCHGHLSRLERTRIGHYTLNQSYSLEEIEKIVQKKCSEEIIITLDKTLQEHPRIFLQHSDVNRIRHGNSIPVKSIRHSLKNNSPLSKSNKIQEPIIRLFDHEGNFCGFAKQIPHSDQIHPLLVIDTKNSSDEMKS